MSSFFYNLGRQVGRKAVPALRRSKWVWQGLTGTEEEAFQAEIALGQEMAAELKATFEVIPEPSMPVQLNDICSRLATHARDKRRTFRCTSFRDEFANAVALPGGFLFFSDSILELCERRADELAFVAGHEMAHVLLGHTWNRMVKEAALQVASAAATRVGQLGGWLRQKGLALLRSAHTADLEFTADELGFKLAIAAGFTPSGALDLLERIAALGPTQTPIGHYLVSHPPAKARAERLRHLLPQHT